MTGRKTNNKVTESIRDPKLSLSDIATDTRALVFISHDSRDAELAEAFANLLKDVSGGILKSFRSSDKKENSGIEFGAEWYRAVMSRLDNATDVVALLTRQSTDRPWILYEAGVAKGKLNTNVLGIALGIPLATVSSGPFGQFQNCDGDENSLTTLVIQLLKRIPDASPREEAVRMQVSAFLEKVKSLLLVEGQTMPTSATDDTDIAKLFEEVKIMIHALPEGIDWRIRSVVNEPSRSGRRLILDLSAVEELLFNPSTKKSSQECAAAWLLFISILKDAMPWIYEVGLELYRALRTSDSRGLSETRHHMMRILEVMLDGSFMHQLMLPHEDTYYIVRHIPELVKRFFDWSESTLTAQKMESKSISDPVNTSDS